MVAKKPVGKRAYIRQLAEKLALLSSVQVKWIGRIIDQFLRPIEIWRNPKSDFLAQAVAESFADTLRMHHTHSREAFSKDKFEYALEAALRACGIDAELAPRGNKGFDIRIQKQRFSLKTQADKGIREDHIHISKFMELGGGRWTDQVSDLVGLRKQFTDNLNGFERILSLRCLTPNRENPWLYELVEIPKKLLLEVGRGELRIVVASSQNPKPGYCEVRDKNGSLRFRLYFDGGGERKLQVQLIDKSLCIVHGRWSFNVSSLEEGAGS